MKKISFKKIIRDLWTQKGRTIIVLLAIIIGAFSVSMMNTAYTLLNLNLSANYLNTNPASLTIIGKNIDLNLLRANPEIADIELREKITGRIQISENVWLPIWVFIVDDFNKIKINTFKIQSGAQPENSSEILIERSAYKIFKYSENKNYSVKLQGMDEKDIMMKGVVHDPGLAPSWMEGIVYGYVKRDSSIISENMEIKATLSQDRYNLKHIQTVLLAIIKEVKEKGGIIERTEIPPPGKHTHETQMNSLMFLLQMFGILVLFLSCFLIINMISAIMTKQMQQIGIMKALGASTRKIAAIYVSIVLFMGIIATSIALPFGITAGKAYSEFTASMLNFTILNSRLPHSDIIHLFFIGIMIPFFVTIFPIYRSSRISIQRAINDYGISGTGKTDKKKTIFNNFVCISTTARLAFKNALRRKGRLILTLITLILGGAFFMTAFNIRSSAGNTINSKFDNQKYDIMVFFSKCQSNDILLNEFKTIPGINNVEFWKVLKASNYNSNGLESSTLEVRCINHLLDSPEIISGKWLSEMDNGVVLNNAAAAKFPEAIQNGKITLKIANVIKEFSIIGISREVFSLPTIYINEKHISGFIPPNNFKTLAFIEYKKENKTEQDLMGSRIEQKLKNKKIEVELILRNDQYKTIVTDHLLVITTMLIMITLLLIIVGGLGVITTMNINVLERRREIGILRAIGLRNKLLYKIFIYEGIFMSIISWLASIIISYPLSYYLGNKFFDIFFETTLNFMISVEGIALWMLIVLLFSGLAILIPARSALKMSTNSILAYE